MAGDWDQDVLAAIVGAGGGPVTIEDIVNEVDYRQRIVLTLDEINGALSRLIAANSIVQEGATFRPAGPNDTIQSFEPITPSTYSAALTTNHESMLGIIRGLDDQYNDPESPVWPKLDGEWRFADTKHRATDLEVEGLSAILTRLVDALSENGFVAAQGPFSSGSGHLEFAIYGRKSDNAEKMLRVAKPRFDAVATKGSSLRVYEWDPTAIGPSSSELADMMAKLVAGEITPEDLAKQS